jgi:hypothetical protein
MARPHSQETTLSTAKTQAPDIGPPEVRPLSAIGRPPNREQNGENESYPIEHDSQSMNEDHRLSPESRFNRTAGAGNLSFPAVGNCFIENSDGLRRHALRTLLAFVLPSRVLLIS